MAARTPIVASAIEGYMNVATDGVNALLPPPGDEQELSRALRRVLDDRQLSDRLVRSGAAHAEEYSMRSLADSYVAIYEEVIRRSADTVARPSLLRRAINFLRRISSNRPPSGRATRGRRSLFGDRPHRP
jgi:hypothetical protein